MKNKEEKEFWEMINFELLETLEYLKDKDNTWSNLSDANKKIIINIVDSIFLPIKTEIKEAAKKYSLQYEIYKSNEALENIETDFINGAEFIKQNLLLPDKCRYCGSKDIYENEMCTYCNNCNTSYI